jgi:hypothetical protein
MKKGKNPTLFVLALEIAAIVVLHAVKLNQNEKSAGNKETTKNAAGQQPDSKMRSSVTLASFR